DADAFAGTVDDWSAADMGPRQQASRPLQRHLFGYHHDFGRHQIAGAHRAEGFFDGQHGMPSKRIRAAGRESPRPGEAEMMERKYDAAGRNPRNQRFSGQICSVNVLGTPIGWAVPTQWTELASGNGTRR